MKVHVIVDFMHIYYKYFYEMKAGKLRRLSSAVSWNGTTIEKDTSLIYYPLKDIEKFRKSFEADGHDVTVSVCFDCKSVRKEADTEESKEYKSNRTNKLSDEDKLDIEYIEKCLRKAGYNVYKVEGYEADDLVSYMVRKLITVSSILMIKIY